jgi:hypothetical protein
MSTAELSLTNESEAERRMQFTTSVRGILGDSISLPAALPPNPMDEYWELEPYEDDVESPLAFLEADIVDAAWKPFMAHLLTDTLINAEVLLPREDSQAIAKVVRRMVDSEGKLIGEHNDNPLLNTLVYECVFDDGTTIEYAANTIASNIFMESDADGFSSSFLYHIIDHKSSGEAIIFSQPFNETILNLLNQTSASPSHRVSRGWDGSKHKSCAARQATGSTIVVLLNFWTCPYFSFLTYYTY